MYLKNKWVDYELLDFGEGQKLERWGNYRTIRPDINGSAIKKANGRLWENVDAEYTLTDQFKGNWQINNEDLHHPWIISYQNLKFYVKLSPHKHLGIFPEQAVNWDFVTETIACHQKVKNVLNLFAYTGGATMAAASAGAKVCHVDASKSIVTWAKQNSTLSQLNMNSRFICEDAIKFLHREIKRNHTYDAIIMDPPAYGLGPKGERFVFHKQIKELLELCTNVLSDDCSFVLLNAYVAGFHLSDGEIIMKNTIVKKFGGSIETAPMGIKEINSQRILPCGSCIRWLRH